MCGRDHGRPRRVALVSDANSFGGAEMALATLLRELGPRFEPVVAGSSPAVLERIAAERPGTPTHALPVVRGKWDLGRFSALARRLRALHIEILHANLPAAMSCRHALAAAALIPSVQTVAVEQLPYPVESPLAARLKRFTSHRLAAHVAVGKQGARDVERLFGLPAYSVRTIYNGVRDVPLRQLPRRSERPVIGAVGRMDRQKGLDVLLRALPDVPDAELVLIGDGEERQPLERLAADLGISERISFDGYRGDARDQLTTFDVLVMPSRFEGLPLAVIDAMLARLPVVATPVGSMSEAVLDGETGLLVPPEEPGPLARALRELVTDRPRREAMGERGRLRALEFSPEAMARDYESLYDEILAAPRRRL